MSQTPYAETEALLAMLRGDDRTAEATIRGMTGYERRHFNQSVERLDKMIYRIRIELDMGPKPS